MINLAQITMNAGWDIPDSTIRWNLENNAKWFKKVFVVDGNLTKKAKEFYSKFENVVVIDSPWKDSYVDQYRAWYDELVDGEWCLYLDCDEVPSKRLVEITGLWGFREKHDDTKIYRVPCILHIKGNDNKYYPAEKKPDSKFTGQWTKNILLQKHDGLYFRHFGSHVIPETKTEKYSYISYPYYHMKTLDSFAYNDVWQAFLSPEGQQYKPVEAAQFKAFTKQYKTTKEFKEATFDGSWNPALEKFALDHKEDFDRPISRLAYVYFYLAQYKRCTPNLSITEKYPLCTRLKLRDHILSKDSMDLFKKNKSEGNYVEISM